MGGSQLIDPFSETHVPFLGSYQLQQEFQTTSNKPEKHLRNFISIHCNQMDRENESVWPNDDEPNNLSIAATIATLINSYEQQFN